MEQITLQNVKPVFKPAFKNGNYFLYDVLRGLTSKNKYLESKYFYDDAGDELFRKIMQCPEYYPTDCEMEIFTSQTTALANAITTQNNAFDVVELGAGDATKSFFLLEELLNRNAGLTYYPVDISQHVIQLLHTELPYRLPSLTIKGLNGEYFKMLERVNDLSDKNKIVLFLGGNVGNIPFAEARQFCLGLRKHLNKNDLLVIGFDLKKDPLTILNAYNDKAGFTRDFNLNLLHRINNELGANFKLNNFYHYPTYDPATGACKSYLVSSTNQHVQIGEELILFQEGETIHMEISQKYTPAQTDELALKSGFNPLAHFYDSKNWFLDAVWRCV